MLDINNELFVEFLNVGFGECIIVRNDKHTIVIDGGDNLSGVYEKNPYRIKLLTYLQKEGISVIDLLIMSHPHRDHIGSLKEVVEYLQIKEAWYPLGIPNDTDKSGVCKDNNMYEALELYKDIILQLEQQGTTLKILSNEYNFSFSDITIKVFPTILENILDVQKNIDLLYNGSNKEKCLDILNDIDKNLNACSLVLRIEYHETKILLTSDILLTYWDFIEEKEQLKANILKMPHHGDIKHASKEFLECVNPEHVIICADNENTYNLPSDNIKEFIEEILPEISLLFTETKESNYNVIRFIIRSNGNIIERKMSFD